MFTSATLALLKRASTRLICADIGSAGGFHPRIKAIQSRADILGFDADAVECERLNKKAGLGERHINAAVGREGETVVVELHAKRQTSSIYKTDMDRIRFFPNSARLATEETVSFQTKSLDRICKEEKIERLDFIKADIEGHELAALQGYSGPLLMTEIEVSFHPFRKDQPLFDEIMAYMRSRGYLLIDLRRTFWHPTAAEQLNGLSTKGFVIVGDSLFILDPFKKESHALLGTPEARARFLGLLCLYGYAAEALMCTDLWSDNGLMPTEEAKASASLIKKECTRHSRIQTKGLGLGRALIQAEKWVKFPVSIRSGLHLGDVAQNDREVGNWE